MIVVATSCILSVLAAAVTPVTARPNDWARGSGLAVVTLASGLASPVHAASPPGDRRLFVVEQPGRIRIVRGDTLLPSPFLDIRDRVRSGGERGLLSVAFHPRYASNGLFFVNYTDRNGDTQVARFRVTRDPDVADPASERRILQVAQPFSEAIRERPPQHRRLARSALRLPSQASMVAWSATVNQRSWPSD